MKKIILASLTTVALFSCKKEMPEGQYVLNGSIDGVPSGQEVYLERNDDSLGVIVIDTAKIENGRFKFEGRVDEPSIYSLAINGVKSRSYVILETGEIDIEIDKDSTFFNKLSGTYNNQELAKFNTSAMEIQKEIEDFKMKNQTKLILAQNDKDTVTINKLRNDFMALQQKMETHNYEYIESHPKSYLSLLLIYNMYNSMVPDMLRMEKYYNALDPELKKNKVANKIRKAIAEFKRVRVGGYAPDFSALGVDGKQVSLKKSFGKQATLIDFWASWCPPCRAENPKLVALYNKYKDNGFNIVSVSLDKPGQADKWKEAIAKDGMTWTHMSNLKHWDDPIAKLYEVDAIPKNFLVNQYGVIIAKDLHGEQLEAKVREFVEHQK